MTTRSYQCGPRRRPARPGAFTLTELLIVIIIMVIAIGIAVPAFSSLLFTSEEALARNTIERGLAAARDAAARSAAGNDAASVFFFGRGGSITIVPCVAVGRVADEDAGGGSVTRTLFAPIPLAEPVQLPREWLVSAYAPPNTIDTSGNDSGWYDAKTYPDASVGNWVFPETAFYDDSVTDDGDDRQTFMVRFEGSTGRLVSADLTPALVLAPSPSQAFRTSFPFRDYRADRAGDLARFAAGILAQPESSLSTADKRRLLGDASPDTVLVRPVSHLALYHSRQLARAIGARGMNRTTGSLYADKPTPEIDTSLFVPAAGESKIAERIRNWIEFRAATAEEQAVSAEARVFAIDQGTGALLELVAIDED